MIQIAGRREFFVGEKPRPIPFEVRNRAGINNDWDGSAVTVIYQNDPAVAEASFSSGAIVNGTGAITIPPTTSIFTVPGTCRMDIKATNSPYDEVLARIIFKVRKRV